MTMTDDEFDKELQVEWTRNPLTVRNRVKMEQRRHSALRELLSAAADSTDARVRGYAQRFNALDDSVVAMGGTKFARKEG